MPVDYSIDAKARAIVITLSGFVSVAEMYEGRRGMVTDAAFDPAFVQLVDARTAKSHELNGYSIKAFAETHVLAAGARRAIVMASIPDQRLAQMFQMYRDLARGAEVTQVFRQMDQALKWLQLPSGYR